MRRYCLYCHRTLRGDANTCGCGRTSLPAERRAYWSRHPDQVRLEQVLKAGIVLATVVAILAMTGSMSGPGGGWLWALPMFAGAALWKTASKLTRHDEDFAAGTLWTAVFALLAAVGAVLGSPVTFLWLALLGATRHLSRVGQEWKEALRRGPIRRRTLRARPPRVEPDPEPGGAATPGPQPSPEGTAEGDDPACPAPRGAAGPGSDR